MKLKFFIFLIITSIICSPLFGQQTSKWGDQGDGTYRNPVLPGDFSDIDAIRVGNDYYAISSTFQYSPGVIILHSKDLVNWEILSHAVNDVTVMGADYNYDKMNRYGTGVWAGSLRYYKGKFWIYYGTPNEGYFMTSATNAAGPWEPLTLVWNTSGGWDDCCSFCDDDGQLYFVATNYSDSYKTYIFKLSDDGKTVIQSSKTFIHQSNGSEANKLYKINGYYYHFFSEVKPEGRVIMMERSQNIWGPYTELKQLNHVNVQGLSDREPNQGGLIQLPDGTWKFLTHHGSGGYWEGREASLLPVTWVSGWPIIGAVGADGIGNMLWSAKMPIKSDKSCFIQTNDEFENVKPSVQWEWNYQPCADKWSLSERPGFLRLKAFKPILSSRGILFRAGNTITQRSLRTERCVAEAKLHIGKMANGQVAGICHYAKTFSTFGIKQVSGIRYIAYNNNGSETLGEAISDTVIYVRSVWDFSGQCQYSYSIDGHNFVSFGSSYAMTWGDYRGDRIAIFSYNELSEDGLIDIDWFHYDYNAKDHRTATDKNPTYVFATFSGDDAEGMKLSIYTSTDAINYSLYSNTGFSGPAGCSLRDPSIMKHTDGKYYVVFTAAPYNNPYANENIVGLASSVDLKTWTSLPSISTADIGGGVKLSWAPEWVVDGSKTPKFIVHCSSQNNDLKPYLFTSVDSVSLTQWSSAVEIGIDAVHLDGQIIKNNGLYHCYIKTSPYLQHATAQSITGPWTWQADKTEWKDMEGPTIIQLPDNTWRMYVDPMYGPAAYMNSTDLFNWSAPINIPNPAGAVLRHGTVIKDTTFVTNCIKTFNPGGR